MGSALAIISKAEFKKLRTDDGAAPSLGTKVAVDSYHSSHKALDTLAAKGALFLVTVLPDDTLWLVAMLGVPRRSNGSWKSQGNMATVADITPLCGKLGLERGDGKLAMRLQTPRAIDDAQFDILSHAANGRTPANAGKAAKAATPAKAAAPAAKPPAKAKAAKPAKPAKPVKVPTLKKGQFAFLNCRSYGYDDILTLDKVHQDQFSQQINAYCGVSEKTIGKTLDAFLKDQGCEKQDFSISLWDVYEGGRAKPRFEYWVQGAGDGMIFDYGRAFSPDSIGSVQHSFEAHGSDEPEALELVEALQAAADKCKGL